MSVQAGDRVGQYLLVREIGKGAMATVYEAEHCVLRKRVALKRLHPHFAKDPTCAARFLNEGRAAVQIRSPHVVEVFDVGAHDGAPHLVMEMLDGRDLAAYLRDAKKLSPQETADLMLPVASAVHAAHLAGVIHRDLKPSNVFLARRGDHPMWPVILDFGISKVISDLEQDLTASESLLGTVHYMSPEQTRGGGKASPASDQHALGVMLYECLTGSRPFAGSTPYSVMHAIVSAKVAPPSARTTGVPPALDEVILRAMARDPQRRFPSVRALGGALLPWASIGTRERYASEFAVEASPRRRRGTRAPKSRAVAMVACGLALAVIAGLGARPSLVTPARTHASTRSEPAAMLPRLALQGSQEARAAEPAAEPFTAPAGSAGVIEAEIAPAPVTRPRPKALSPKPIGSLSGAPTAHSS